LALSANSQRVRFITVIILFFLNVIIFPFTHRTFSKGLSFFFLLGVAAPFCAWLVSLNWPKSFIRYVNFPVIFAGTGLIPPASAVNYVPWAIVGFIFQYVIRRRHLSWWTKYNYVLSAALDSGVAISIVVIFFWYVFLLLSLCAQELMMWALTVACNILEIVLLAPLISVHGGVSKHTQVSRRKVVVDSVFNQVTPSSQKMPMLWERQ